jgi:hypothetical protein
MKLSYNVTGAERKTLVGAISSELNLPTRYLGMPTAAYMIGEYTIDKTGVVTGPDNRDLVADLQGLHSFIPVTEAYDTPVLEIGDLPAFEDLVLTEEEELGLGQQRRDPSGEDGMQASDVPESESRIYQVELSDPDCPDRMEVFRADDDEDAIREAYEYVVGDVVVLELNELDEDYNFLRSVDLTLDTARLVIEMPLDGFTPEKLDNLARLVSAKASLLKAALGVDDLRIQQTGDTLRFPWFSDGLDADTVKAYATLVGMICAAAKGKQRVTAREKDPANKKYAMRCWLLSLGFIGEEYKTSRKILLSKLDGSSSFKNGTLSKIDEGTVAEQ